MCGLVELVWLSCLFGARVNAYAGELYYTTTTTALPLCRGHLHAGMGAVLAARPGIAAADSLLWSAKPDVNGQVLFMVVCICRANTGRSRPLKEDAAALVAPPAGQRGSPHSLYSGKDSDLKQSPVQAQGKE